MGERTARVVGLLAAAALLAACGGGGSAGDGAAPDRLVLGLVPSAEVDQLAIDAEGLGGLLSARLGVPVDTVIVPGDGALVAGMRTGGADVALFGPLALVRAVDDAEVVPVLQSVRRGASSRHAQWITADPARFCSTPVVAAPGPEERALAHCNGTETVAPGPVGEDALARIDEGDAVMFVGEGSAAGHHYPATQLRQAAGLDPLTEIDARFTAGDLDSVRAVAGGEVVVGVRSDDAPAAVPADASADGASADSDEDDADADADDAASDDDEESGPPVTVFARSAEILHDGVAVRGDLPAEFRQRVADAMTAVIATPEGAAAFAAVYAIEGLVPVDPGALDVARRVAAAVDG